MNALVRAGVITLVLVSASIPAATAARRLPAGPPTLSSWPQLGSDARRTSFNAHETHLTSGTVSGLHVVWSQDTGGAAVNGIVAPPVVADRVVYVLSSASYASAFAANDGTLIWGNRGDCFACIAPAAPAVSDKVLLAPVSPAFSSTGSSTVSGIGRRDDRVRWTIGAAGPWTPSPAIVGRVMYEGYPDCCTGNAGVEARDVSTGERLWFSTKGDPYSSVAVGDGYVLTGGYALDAGTGAVRWNHPDFAARIVGHGAVFGFCDGYLCALEEATGTLHWTSDVEADHLALAGHLLFASGAGVVRAFEARTGAPLWSTDVGAGSVSVAGRVVYVSSGTSLLALDATDGTLLATVDLGTPLTQPVIASGYIYVGGRDGTLYALSS